jgi:hypothetical protein
MSDLLQGFLAEKGVQIGHQIKLSDAAEFIRTHYYYDQNLGLLYEKQSFNLNQPTRPMDLAYYMSSLGYSSSETVWVKALSTSFIDYRSTLSLQFDKLPLLENGEDPIGELAKLFKTNNDEQFVWLLKYWLTNAAGQIIEPNNIQAVNRLVLCLQSAQQRIGKTQFFRWLAKPFDTVSTTSMHEYDRPEFSNDAKISYSSNLLVLLDDIDSWSGRGLQQMKSLISSKRTKVRPPYGTRAIDSPRTASFAATTNSYSFLTESGNTRWAVFEVFNIDFNYSVTISPEKVWSQAKSYWTTADCEYKVLTQEKVDLIIQSNKEYIYHNEIDAEVAAHLEYDENVRNTPSELFRKLPTSIMSNLGPTSVGVQKLGRIIAKSFNPKEITAFKMGVKYYKLRPRQ